MDLRLVIREDADWNHYPYHENFWTSLVAAGILKARSSPENFKGVPIWWKEESQPDGNLEELIDGTFRMNVLRKSAELNSAPDILLEAQGWVVVVESKLGTRIEAPQFDVFELLRKTSNARKATYLLMAPGGFNTGQLGKFYAIGSQTGIRAGFLDLARTVNWAWSLLGLGQPAWGEG